LKISHDEYGDHIVAIMSSLANLLRKWRGVVSFLSTTAKAT
jgi:hypothetical protein